MKAKLLGFMGLLLAALTAAAQTGKPGETAFEDGHNNAYDHVRTVGGRRVEEIQMDRRGKTYKADFLNDSMTALFVDGEKIPESGWAAYSQDIVAIRIQIKLNPEQAKRNQQQAVLNQLQEKKNAEQASRNEQQEKKNAEQAMLNEQQAKKNDEQNSQNEVQEKKNHEQVFLNELQAKKNAEQASRNEVQAKNNQEQNVRNEEQAKRNQEQAQENERFIKQITQDLVNDKIISDKNGLHEMTFNSDEMIINGVKQSDGIFKKYKEKYPRFSKGSFNYSRDGIMENN